MGKNDKMEKAKLLAPGGMSMNEDPIDPRLKRLDEHNKLKIHQKPRGWCCSLCGECCGCDCCCQFENDYKVMGEHKHPIYDAREHSSFCCLNCCGPRRSFSMTFDDDDKGHKHDKSPVMEMERPFRLRWFCCPCDCCHQEVIVSSQNRPLGTVFEVCWCCVPTLDVKDKHGDLRYQLKGDNMCCRCHGICTFLCRCCPEYTLTIHDTEGKKCGKIKKKFSGVAKELATSADNYKVDFPHQAGTTDRALLLASAIFCDYLYFEKPNPVEKKEDNKK